MGHLLHERIFNLIVGSFKDYTNLKIIKDPACLVDNDRQHIPLFQTQLKSRDTHYCCVDMLILQKGKIRLIIEIEETNIKPTQVCGKFLTSALSKFYIHKKDCGIIKMADSVAFIQVLDSSKLKVRSVKKNQFTNLEHSIQNIIPLKDSRINKYKLFVGKHDESFQGMIDFIKDEIKNHE